MTDSKKGFIASILSFFKGTWRIISYNKIVLGALIVFFAIVAFAVIGPMFVRPPFQQVKLNEIVEQQEQLFSPQFSKTGTIGEELYIACKVDEGVLNTTEGEFKIQARMLTWTTSQKNELLTGQIEFSLWRGNISTYEADNAELVETKTVTYDQQRQEYIAQFTIPLSTENAEAPYVLSFTHQGTDDDGEYTYQLKGYAVWFEEQLTLQKLESPSFALPLGTDEFAYDSFAQLANATRNSLMVGFAAGITATLVAVIIGSVAGYAGGFWDDTSQLIVNIMMVFPVYPLLIILAAFIESRSLLLVAGIIAAISWPWAARSIRSQILSLKERDFVRLAKVSGIPGYKIAVLELLPNMMAYIILIFAIQTGGAIAAEAGISMIGFGPDPRKHITLGTMLYWVLYGESVRSGFWWLYLPPGVILTVFFVILYVLQANLDELFNPRLRKGG